MYSSVFVKFEPQYIEKTDDRRPNIILKAEIQSVDFLDYENVYDHLKDEEINKPEVIMNHRYCRVLVCNLKNEKKSLVNEDFSFLQKIDTFWFMRKSYIKIVCEEFEDKDYNIYIENKYIDEDQLYVDIISDIPLDSFYPVVGLGCKMYKAGNPSYCDIKSVNLMKHQPYLNNVRTINEQEISRTYQVYSKKGSYKKLVKVARPIVYKEEPVT